VFGNLIVRDQTQPASDFNNQYVRVYGMDLAGNSTDISAYMEVVDRNVVFDNQNFGSGRWQSSFAIDGLPVTLAGWNTALSNTNPGTVAHGSDSIAPVLLNAEHVPTSTSGSIDLSSSAHSSFSLIVHDAINRHRRAGGIWTVGAFQKDYATAVADFQWESFPHYLDVAFNRDVGTTIDVSDFEIVMRKYNASTQALDSPVTLNAGSGSDFMFVMSYDALTHIARISFVGAFAPSGLLPTGRYTFRIKDNSISDPLGGPFDTPAEAPFFSLLSDVNHDAQINFDDLLIIGQNYGVSVTEMLHTFDIGDADHDGTVDFDDLLSLAQQYGFVLPS
jgi:hypothetical protein